jgi:hypothetical protein
MKGGVRTGGIHVAGIVVAGIAVAGTVGAGVSVLGGERVASAKGNLDANGVCRPAGGWLRCSSGREVACVLFSHRHEYVSGTFFVF